MQKIDLDQERQRLTKRYAAMSDGELEKVAENPGALTEWARVLLRAEMTKRGLEWKEELISEFRPPVEMPNDDTLLVLLQKHENTAKAAEVRRALREAGIQAFFFDDNEATSEGHVTWIAGDGVKLLVRATDLAIGLELLARQETIVEKAVAAGETKDRHQDGGRPVVLRSYRDITEAMVDRTMLESAGIKYFLYDDNLIRLDWFVSNAVGGVKVVVAENEAAEALKILDAANEGRT